MVLVLFFCFFLILFFSGVLQLPSPITLTFVYMLGKVLEDTKRELLGTLCSVLQNIV